MKKALKASASILLAAGLAFSALVFSGAAAAEQSLKILVASDIHYQPPGELPPLSEVNDLPGDPMFPHANTKGLLRYEADAVLDAFFNKAQASGAQYLLIPGDMSEGKLSENQALAEKLLAFEKRSGIQVFVIPGNHDIRAADAPDSFDLNDFLHVYAQLGYDKALVRREGDASYTAELGGGYRLLAIDGCVYGASGSRVTPELYAWIEQQMLSAREDGKKLIAMTHFNLLEHYLINGFADGSQCIEGHRALAAALADNGVKYVFTGHGHANDIAYAETKAGNKLFDIETGSLTTYPNAWREVTFSGGGVRFEAKYIEEIDTSLLPEGFGKAQIDAMESDFSKYSLNFFTAGIRSFGYQVPQITRRFARNLKIAEGTAAYDAVGRAFSALMDAANTPMRGETDSVEAIAKKAGVTIDPGAHINPLDLVGAIYAGHFAGNESYTLDSPEVRLLGQAVNAVLVALLPDIDILTTLAAKGIYMPNPAKHVTKNLVKTLADGILTDWSAPDDLNVTLEPYGEQWALDGYAVKTTDFAFALDVISLAARLALHSVRDIAR